MEFARRLHDEILHNKESTTRKGSILNGSFIISHTTKRYSSVGND